MTPTRRHPTRRHRGRRLRGGERGSVTAELALATPLLLLLLMVLAQVALWQHATHIAQAAAAQALNAARVQHGSTTDGHAAAHELLGQLGHGPLRDPQVTVTRTAQQATATVSGTATAVIPWLRLRVHGEAAGPVETYRDPAGGPTPTGTP
jgi:Flp pilus assembly protein TadG